MRIENSTVQENQPSAACTRKDTPISVEGEFEVALEMQRENGDEVQTNQYSTYSDCNRSQA